MPSNKKGNQKNSAIIQILLIISAFVIIGVSSYLFVNYTEKQHLNKNSTDSLAITEAKIDSYFLFAEDYLIICSETIKDMILSGNDEIAVYNYMKNAADSILPNTNILINIINIHGYFFNWEGKYLSVNNINNSEDISPQNRQWFIKAINTNKVTVSKSAQVAPENIILTFSRAIIDENKEFLCVICMDIEMNSLIKTATAVNFTENSYGFLLDSELNIIAHPQTAFQNRKLIDINSGVAALAPLLESGLNVNERKVRNYTQDNSIVYLKKIKYNWYIGIIIPIQEYYKNINNMAAFLIIINSLLASALCIMFYYIHLAKLRSDLRTSQKSNFLATMSHEIRTPLNAILGMTEIQMQDTTHRPSTSEAFIKINNSGNLLLNIINDILDLSKIEAGKLELAPVKYEVANLINDITQLNYIRYESKPIEFILEIDENIPSTLIGDDLRIKQILNNVLSNAFKYTDKGQVVFSVNAECISRSGFVLVTLIFTVKDTGQGMTQDQVNKLFDEYTRFNMEANRTTEGAGLGMTITRNLVNLMSGKITVKSAVNEGTTVTIRLPQKTDGMGISGILGKETAEILNKFRHGGSLQPKKIQFTHEYMPYGRILIVDDVETNLYIAKGLMVPYGLTIDLATSGFETIEKIKQGKVYDIIFMDHMMPKMDGIETTRQLRNLGYTLPIVALTANALTGQAEIFLQNGFNGFISKPIDVRHLNMTLNRLIRDKQSPEVLEAAEKEKQKNKNSLTAGEKTAIVDSQLAEIFSRDAEKALKTLEKCINKNLESEDNIHLYIVNVHSMKSALANIGETELSATALRLEQAGREKDINVMLAETRNFIDELRAVVNRIKPQNTAANEDSEKNLILLNEQLIIIKEACLSLDKKTAKDALNKLMEITWSSGVKELLGAIAEHLLHSEFDDAAAAITGYIK